MINNKCGSLVKNKRKCKSTIRFQNINLIKKIFSYATLIKSYTICLWKGKPEY